MRTVKTCLLAALVCGLSGSPQPADAKAPKCFPREGHCVAVTVNGQASVELAKATKKALKELEEIHHQVDDTRYELVEPVRGELDVRAGPVEGSEGFFGPLREVDVGVIPLQEVRLETHRERSTAETVRIGGRAVVTEADVLDENRLPPGRYLLMVTLRGDDNWDRQVAYAVVEE